MNSISEEDIYSYFEGTLSSDKKESLFSAMSSDKDLQEVFCRIQNLWALSSMQASESDEAYAVAALVRLKKKIAANKRQRFAVTFLRYAAVFALIVGAWFVSKQVNEPGVQEAYLWLETPVGQSAFYTLPDSSTVELNPASRLRIPTVFGKDSREILLLGEGYFSVKTDPSRPFIVNTESHKIEVLGTEFNVFAYPTSGLFETDLVKGSLKVSDMKGASLVISPKEKAYESGGKLVKGPSNFAQGQYAKKGLYTFTNVTLEFLLKRLELWFGGAFVIKDKSILNQKYTLSFRQSDDITDILEAIHRVGKLNYKILKDGIIEIYSI